jgi:hypothetical protein
MNRARWINGKTHRGTDAEAKARKNRETGEVWIWDNVDRRWLRLMACAWGTFTDN